MKAAFVGFGEVNTPREIIERKCAEAQRLLEAEGLELIATAPVSDDPDGQDVARAVAELSGQDFDALILCVAGWIPSHAVIAVADVFRHKPMVLWGLTGWSEGGRFITTADQAGTTALREPMRNMGFTFKYVVSYRGQPLPVGKVAGYARAAHAAARLRGARIGSMGYRDMRLYGTMFDGVSLRAKIGPEVECFEMLEMVQAMERLDPAQVAEVCAEMPRRWQFVREPQPQTLENTARLYLALKTKVQERGYEALTLTDVDGVKKLLGFAPAGVFMLLAENEGLCTVPENDILGAVTQLMTRYLTGQIGAYLEFYEFLEDGALMGVPDYVPSEVVDGPVSVLPTAFGDFGEGLLNVSRVKTGPVTLARLRANGDSYSFHAVTGEARTPAPWEEAGWAPPAPQLPSLEITLPDVERFVSDVASQHYIISYGDHTEAYSDLCNLLDVWPW
jgi:L-fucose isomerase-like protein